MGHYRPKTSNELLSFVDKSTVQASSTEQSKLEHQNKELRKLLVQANKEILQLRNKIKELEVAWIGEIG